MNHHIRSPVRSHLEQLPFLGDICGKEADPGLVAGKSFRVRMSSDRQDLVTSHGRTHGNPGAEEP